MPQYEIMRRSEHMVGDSSDLNVLHPVVRRVLANRNIVKHAQIDSSLAGMLKPNLLGVEVAATRLATAIETGESIQIVGDYDVDGATSTVLAIEVLRQMGARAVSYCVPNRFEYGYGLSLKLAQDIIDAPPDLIITVDNGIASVEGVALLKQQGVDVIVTDHHLPGEQLPEAVAIVNPNQKGCIFPSKMLAGVGVVFYLMMVLRAKLQADKWFDRKKLAVPALVDQLDLVALGTVADLVSLDENNRILVAQGVARMRAGRTRPGIAALFNVAKRSLASLVANDLGFVAGPRLNAAGRLADISTGIECLLAKDEQSAMQFAGELDAINQQRKEIESSMQRQAFACVDAMQLTQQQNHQFAAALYQQDWHEGVIGLVASRVKDKINMPVAVFAQGADGLLKGSCRSIKEVHIRDVLATINARNPQLIVKFGGHAMAAGLSIERDNFDLFSQAFCQEIKRIREQLPADNQIWTDGSLQAEDIELQLAESLRTIAPWGQGFPAPTFDGRFNVLSSRIVGDSHLKLCLQAQSGGASIDAIAFRYLDAPDKPTQFDAIDAVYSLDVNEFRGTKSVQLIIQYLEAA